MGEQPRGEKGRLRLGSEKATRILKDMNVHRAVTVNVGGPSMISDISPNIEPGSLIEVMQISPLDTSISPSIRT